MLNKDIATPRHCEPLKEAWQSKNKKGHKGFLLASYQKH
jgi:hypothetical protein